MEKASLSSLTLNQKKLPKKGIDKSGSLGLPSIRGMGYYSRKDLDIVCCVVSRNEGETNEEHHQSDQMLAFCLFLRPMILGRKACFR